MSASDVSAVVNHFSTASEGFVTTLSSTAASGASTLALTSVSGLTNGNIFVGIIEPGTVGKEQTFTGTVDTAGTQITGVKWTRGSNTGHNAGVSIVDYVSGTGHNMMTKGMLVEHKQTGLHSDIHADSLAVSGTSALGAVTATSLTLAGTATAEGWSPLGATPDTVTANGNKSYDLVFNSNDLTDTITPGMRLRTARTVAAPIQSTSLNGTTQYYSKSSPNKMTFTDDFCVSAWVKLSRYGATSSVVTRYNGTSGWKLVAESDGRVSLQGFNAGAANFSVISSYQSIPLNKWVHVAGQLDMSAFTSTTTTSYIMIDGVDVPAASTRGGTNPTALIQAGNLEIGSSNGGTNFFPGKIAQVAIYNAKVTQATHLAAMNQGLVGTETSLASAYSFSNSITDLNTTTPNDLTANGSAVATNTDSPFGNSGVSTTLDYGIVMAASFSTNTTLTVQVPEGCTIPSSGGVSTVDYSTQDIPYGFPRQKGKWRIQSLFRVQVTAGANTTFGSYNGGGDTITVPVGEWIFGADMPIFSGSVNPCEFALTADAITGTAFGGWLKLEEIYRIQASAAATYFNTCTRRYPISVSVATKYTLYQGASSSVSGAAGIDSDNQLHQFVAENAYV